MSDGERFDEEVTRSDLVHERLRESPLKRWIVLDGNRYTLTALFSLAVYLVCIGIGFAGWSTRSGSPPVASHTADFGPFVPRVDFEE
ncbi:hypothetical protein GS429_16450 [Natronorubrum sp. JWXQ-INN-674]|uniref:Uncharacterized protein n=1 Tax=Natronorubrum halalkaliphilum TaxID=2691917 RepID=A0A6B0VPR4_9EURY|nr:hypothetical protein [Natronorubrum halalkaliphilum]MXV63620.1 hypothetical protein [Natronorubrum halalkaliphilum]